MAARKGLFAKFLCKSDWLSATISQRWWESDQSWWNFMIVLIVLLQLLRGKKWRNEAGGARRKLSETLKFHVYLSILIIVFIFIILLIIIVVIIIFIIIQIILILLIVLLIEVIIKIKFIVKFLQLEFIRPAACQGLLLRRNSLSWNRFQRLVKTYFPMLENIWFDVK